MSLLLCKHSKVDTAASLHWPKSFGTIADACRGQNTDYLTAIRRHCLK
jgi:hypothetical protein